MEPIPTPSILDEQDHFGVRGGRRVWRSKDGQRYYTWDGLHGEVEVFNRRGRHLGALDPHTGELIKPAVKGRRLDV
ncbi:MAG: colicin E3/pyocin S6 family cytotoxin [Acidobacteriota bacterium]